MKMYVGGLSYSVTEEALKTLFSEYGEVAAVNLVKDGTTGQSRGFGFVEMPVREDAEKALAELAGKDFEGQTMAVEQARERQRVGARPRGKRPGGDGGRGGFGGGGRSGGRGRS